MGKRLSFLLNYLRALSIMYHYMHWKTTCSYDVHLLFERLYGGVSEELDGVAEKAIGASDNDVIAPIRDIKSTLDLLSKFIDDETPCSDFMVHAIKAEEALLKIIEEVMGEDNSDGVEDMVQGIASLHEEHLYLLKQYVKKEARIIYGLNKVAESLDRKGKYDESDVVFQIMKEIQK